MVGRRDRSEGEVKASRLIFVDEVGCVGSWDSDLGVSVDLTGHVFWRVWQARVTTVGRNSIVKILIVL